VLGHIISEQM